MSINIVDNSGGVAYASNDSTRQWVENHRKGGLVKPQLLLRYATDTNYVQNRTANLFGSGGATQETKAMMNLGLPCQRVHGAINWSVTEGIDNIAQTASVECINALPLSTITATLASGGITVTEPRDSLGRGYLGHSSIVTNSWIAQGDGVVGKFGGNSAAAYGLQESDVKYRKFQHQTFTIAGATGTFPDPAIPLNDVDNDLADSAWPISSTGVGAYFVLIGTEVVRVVQKSGNTFYIPPGGRGINGLPQLHTVGEKVTLLGFGPFSNNYCAMGYLNIDDYFPQKALLRPGTCLVSYEGYGDIPKNLTHDASMTNGYAFTGYWFVTGLEPSIAADGTPKVRIDLKSAGYLYDQQKITPDIVRRMAIRFNNWRVAADDGVNLWGSSGYDRQIPSDWVDYHSWDPVQRDSYPLRIKTEIAQNKEFFDHMNSTEMGTKCDQCRQERADWIKAHPNATELVKERGTGRHIYKTSIRVIQETGGPLKTYVRLMGTMCIAAWDHPAYGTELAQDFTKIPSKLFENMRNIYTGLCYNGQISIDRASTDNQDFDWTELDYEDSGMYLLRDALVVPWESSYDRAPFSQPMQELAEMNGCNFQVHRQGYPIFKPTMWDLRPSGYGYKNLTAWKAQDWTGGLAKENSEWYLTYGGSIDQYSHSINAESIITQCWVTADTAFSTTGSEAKFTIASAGTGWKSAGKFNGAPVRTMYSPLAGNKEGLALTSGVQQVDTISVDNQYFGLSWDTHPANIGAVVETSGGYSVLNTYPPMDDGVPALDSTVSDAKYRNAIIRIQKTVNFFLIRHIISPVLADGKYYYQIAEDGKFGTQTKEGVKALQTFVSVTSNGTWNATTYKAVLAWLTTNKHYIEFDIWWYVQNSRDWAEYISALTGVPIPMKATSDIAGKTSAARSQTDLNKTLPQWVPDAKGMKQNIEAYGHLFAKTAINIGNRRVDDSLNRATVRSISVNLADPRIQIGDTIWCEIPGFLTGQKIGQASFSPPFYNGIYVTNITRTMDLVQGTYTGSYSGYRARGQFETWSQNLLAGWEFITSDKLAKEG